MVDSTLGTGQEPAGDRPQAQAEVTVALPARLVIAEVEACRTQLVDALATGAPVVVDASAVETADAAGLQLLIAARQSALHAGRRFRLSGAAEGPLRQALVTAGFLARAQHETDGFWRGEG